MKVDFLLKCEWCLAIEMRYHNARVLWVVFKALLRSFYGVLNLNPFGNVANCYAVAGVFGGLPGGFETPSPNLSDSLATRYGLCPSMKCS